MSPTSTETVPRFSIVVPLYNTSPFLLQEMVASVQLQTFTDWELILIDDASPDEATRVSARACAASDARIRLTELPENRGIAEASNAGMRECRGEFVALLDHDDTLDPRALDLVDRAIDAGDDIDYVYTDQDVMTDKGHYRIPFSKPEWSPERMLGQMYTSHLSVFRRTLLEQVGPFDSAYDGSQDHDLVLRFTERARGIAHVPEVLYHWRAVPGSTALNGSEKSYAWAAGAAAVSAAVARRGFDAEVSFGPNFGTYTVDYALSPATSVSVIIPAGADGQPIDAPRIDGLLADIARAAGPVAEIDAVIVHPSGTPRPTERSTVGMVQVRVEESPSTEFTSMLQYGALGARGDVLVFIGGSIVDLPARSVARVAGPTAQDDVALVGGRIVFADGTVKHAGYRKSKLHLRDAFRGWPAYADSTYGALTVNREVSAVSTEFAAVRRDAFLAVGGFSPVLDGYCAELDLACKIRARGARVLSMFGPAVTSSDTTVPPHELPKAQRKVIAARWGWKGVDPYTP